MRVVRPLRGGWRGDFGLRKTRKGTKGREAYESHEFTRMGGESGRFEWVHERHERKAGEFGQRIERIGTNGEWAGRCSAPADAPSVRNRVPVRKCVPKQSLEREKYTEHRRRRQILNRQEAKEPREGGLWSGLGFLASWRFIPFPRREPAGAEGWAIMVKNSRLSGRGFGV